MQGPKVLGLNVSKKVRLLAPPALLFMAVPRSSIAHYSRVRATSLASPLRHCALLLWDPHSINPSTPGPTPQHPLACRVFFPMLACGSAVHHCSCDPRP